MMQKPVPRRTLFALGGGLAVAVLNACTRRSRPLGAASPATSTAAPAAGATAAATSCALQVETGEGPFWLTDHPEASDLVQDRQGVPFALTLAVVDTACKPIANARVDIWHCDAEGTYAGVDAGAAGTRTSPENWLQGWQTGGADGKVAFKTIYPGWYPGRAVHIHVKVFAGGNELHTGQLFFPDDISKQVFANAPYRAGPDTTNSEDGIESQTGSSAVLSPKKAGNGYAAEAQLAVNR